MQRSAKLALVACIVVVIGGAVGFWYFVLRDTAPPPPSLGAAAGTVPGSVPTSADGTWTTMTGQGDAYVGYRILELFAADTVKKEAVGRTNALVGELVIDGSTVTAATITADVTQLESDQAERDAAVRERGLETDAFPTATFTLTAPIELPGEPVVGREITVEATGDLTLHGVTKPVTVPIEAVWTGATVEVVGTVPILLADYGIERISVPLVTIDEQGSLELQLVFTPA